MTPEEVRQLSILSRQLTENLMSASLCAKEINEIARSQNDGHPAANGNGHRRNGSPSEQRPLLDEETLSVTWKGRTIHLGNTQGFWLLARLARRANQYVTHLALLLEFWDDEFADPCLLRAGVQRLRYKLRRGGMADLASAITGHHGRYMLDLTSASRH
jgi:DNA-binding response OmpR family regulator